MIQGAIPTAQWPVVQNRIRTIPPVRWWEIEDETTIAAYDPDSAENLIVSYTNKANPGTHTAFAQGVNAELLSLGADGWEIREARCVRCEDLFPNIIESSMIMIYYIDIPGNNYIYGAFDGNRWHIGVFGGTAYIVSEGGSYVSIPTAYPVTRPVTLGMSGGRFFVDGIDIGAAATGTKPVYDISIGAISASVSGFSNLKYCDVAKFAAFSTVLDAAQMLQLSNQMKGT